jgi:hypothetical protein
MGVATWCTSAENMVGIWNNYDLNFFTVTDFSKCLGFMMYYTKMVLRLIKMKLYLLET